MPKKRLPPYVQVIARKAKPDRFRGWAMVGGKRMFGPTRDTADKAHKDALKMRGARDVPVWGGAFETRADEWLADRAGTVAADTVAFYKGKLKNLYRTIPKTMPVDRITPAVIREFIREARQKHGLGARTIQHCRRTLNALFIWMQRRGFLHDNPCTLVDWPKPEDTQPDVLNEAELMSCLARITDTWAADLAVFIAYTGLRRAEMARLKVGDVGDGALWIHGKARSESHPIDGDAVPAQRRLLARASGREFVVPGETDKGRREKIADTFRTWQRKLKEPRWHPHALRHSVATIMIRKGISPAVVQRFLRHSSYAMTQRYVSMVADDMRAATSSLRLLGGESEAKHG